MSLKTRLDKLERPLLTHWYEAWAHLVDAVSQAIPESIVNPPRLVRGEERAEELALELQTHLGAVLTGEDLLPWGHWYVRFDAMSDVDPDRPDLNKWPHLIPEPPPEPPGLWDRLMPLTAADSAAGLAATDLLCLLVLARAWRTHRQR